jgi:Zn-dependent metalloprotease
MPTLLSDREAVKASRKAEQRAALARAKQWHEERLNSLPVLHDPTSSKTLKPSPKKLTNTSTTKRVQSKKATAPALAEAMPVRKSPTRAEARAKARAWADEKKRATVPVAIDTQQRGNAHRIAVVEEDSSTSDFSDDFQTALTRSSTKDNGQILVSKVHVKKVLEMKNQMKMALKKFEDLCEPYEESINSKLESMDIDE